MSIRRNTRALVGSAAVAGLLALGASAFTASNTFTKPSQVVGTGAQTVTGATISSVDYNLDSAGTQVTSVTLVLAGDTTNSDVSIGFNAGDVALCSDSGTVASGETTYACTGLSQAISTLTSFHVVVNEAGA